VLLWIAGGLFVLGTLGGLDAASSSPYGPSAGVGLFPAFITGLLAVVQFATGIGLWQMKKWAWWLVVIVQSLGLALALLNSCVGFSALNAPRAAGTPGTAIISGLIGLLVSGLVLYWFTQNRHLFDDESRYVQQPAGAGGGSTAAIVIGVLVVVVVVPVVVIVILALLGPAIGNVFSNIVRGI
jgi:hypothetical protein